MEEKSTQGPRVDGGAAQGDEHHGTGDCDHTNRTAGGLVYQQDTWKSTPSVVWLPLGYAPGDHDVICARGARSYNHSGNKRFRAHIESLLERYSKASSKLEKSLIVMSVVDDIRRSGRFVRQDTKGTMRWYEVEDKTAREKTGQAIREGLKQRQKKISGGGDGNPAIKKPIPTIPSIFPGQEGTSSGDVSNPTMAQHSNLAASSAAHVSQANSNPAGGGDNSMELDGGANFWSPTDSSELFRSPFDPQEHQNSTFGGGVAASTFRQTAVPAKNDGGNAAPPGAPWFAQHYANHHHHHLTPQPLQSSPPSIHQPPGLAIRDIFPQSARETTALESNSDFSARYTLPAAPCNVAEPACNFPAFSHGAITPGPSGGISPPSDDMPLTRLAREESRDVHLIGSQQFTAMMRATSIGSYDCGYSNTTPGINRDIRDIRYLPPPISFSMQDARMEPTGQHLPLFHQPSRTMASSLPQQQEQQQGGAATNTSKIHASKDSSCSEEPQGLGSMTARSDVFHQEKPSSQNPDVAPTDDAARGGLEDSFSYIPPSSAKTNDNDDIRQFRDFY